MYLDKETYERAGLVGKPDGAKGNRAGKPRWSKSTFLPGHPRLHLTAQSSNTTSRLPL